jgi:hypothetical protein
MKEIVRARLALDIKTKQKHKNIPDIRRFTSFNLCSDHDVWNKIVFKFFPWFFSHFFFFFVDSFFSLFILKPNIQFYYKNIQLAVSKKRPKNLISFRRRSKSFPRCRKTFTSDSLISQKYLFFYKNSFFLTCFLTFSAREWRLTSKFLTFLLIKFLVRRVKKRFWGSDNSKCVCHRLKTESSSLFASVIHVREASPESDCD